MKIKIFVIYHQELGYRTRDGYFTPDLQMARKFNRKCDATQSWFYSQINTDFLDESEVLGIDLEVSAW